MPIRLHPLAWLQAREGTRGPASTGLLWSQSQECRQVPENRGGLVLGSLGNSGQWLEAPECGAPAGGTSHPHGISLPLI